MRRGVGIVLAVGLLSGCAWSQYRGNAAHTGANPWAPGVTVATLGDLAPAWTSADHGALAEEVTARDGRVLVPGSAALWALDLATGADRWHVDRTFGHQSNTLTAASTWRASGTSVVAMTQLWSDSISGTPYFQNIGQVTQLDLATGATLSSEARAGTPPAATDDWAYFPQVHIIAVPASIGPSEIDIKVVARKLDGSGTTFTAALSGSVPIVTDLAVDGDRLYVRDRFGLKVYPAHGCGQPSCAPTWTSDYGTGSSFGRIAVAGGRLFDLDQNGKLTVLPATCATATCAPIWTASVTYGPKGMAVAGDRLYVTAGATLSVFAAGGCGAATCNPQWTSSASGPLSSPSIVNDVVLAGTTSGALVAWNRSGCGVPTCPVTWSQAQGGAVGPVTPLSHALLFPVGGAVRKLVVPG